MSQNLSGATRLAGVIGYPARYSLSPALHNAAYEAMGLDIAYLALPVTDNHLGSAIDAIRAFDMVGVSVTIPHKEAVVKLVDGLSPVADRLSAVNCIVNTDGRLAGHNTDGEGFIKALAEDLSFSASAKKCVVVGAGGAARAVIAALALADAAEVVVVNRSADKASDAARLAGAAGRVGSVDDIADANLIINATPIGMAGHESSMPTPFDTALFSAEQCVVDLVYHPLQTALLAQAAQKGALTMNGLSMLIHQAAVQIELWTGESPPIDVMRAAVK